MKKRGESIQVWNTNDPGSVKIPIGAALLAGEAIKGALEELGMVVNELLVMQTLANR